MVNIDLARGQLSLSDEIFNKILVCISEGQWKEGEKLPSESQLCKMFSVSRVSIRSALRRLQGQGLITTMHGVGSFVTIQQAGVPTNIQTVASSDITGKAFLEFFEFRQAIEFKAIDLFVTRATDNEMEHLRKIVAEMGQCCNRESFGRLDYEFHFSIVQGAKNKYLISALTPYASQYIHYLSEISRLSPKSIREFAEEHAKFYQALENKRPSQAKDFLLMDNTFYHKLFFDRNMEDQ